MMQQGNGNMQQQQQGNANANSDFTPLQQAVLDVFNNDDKPEGLSVQFVARHVNGATEEQVRVRTSFHMTDRHKQSILVFHVVYTLQTAPVSVLPDVCSA
jgi:Replication protein A C terminal